METIDRLSITSSVDELDLEQLQDLSSEGTRPSADSQEIFDQNRAYHARSATPSSWYAGLATAPPRTEDFLVYDDVEYEEPQQQINPDFLVKTFDAKGVEVFDKLPQTHELNAAGELPVYDANGTPSAFKSLYRGPQAVGCRQLVVLIRHFFCHTCKSYVRQLYKNIEQQDINDPNHTSVVLISCSSYKLIDAYRQYTSPHFRIYADPSRKLFKALGCKSWALSFGSRPQYAPTMNKLTTAFVSLRDYGAYIPKGGFGGGSIFQVGGEFLFEQGRLVWCHRMRHIRDHAEMATIKQVLGTSEEQTDLDDDEASVSTQSCTRMPTETDLYRISESLEAVTINPAPHRLTTDTLSGSTLSSGRSLTVSNRESIVYWKPPRRVSSRNFDPHRIR